MHFHLAHLSIWKKEFRGSVHQDMYRALRFNEHLVVFASTFFECFFDPHAGSNGKQLRDNNQCQTSAVQGR